MSVPVAGRATDFVLVCMDGQALAVEGVGAVIAASIGADDYARNTAGMAVILGRLIKAVAYAEVVRNSESERLLAGSTSGG